jgi:hypothetical protein
MMVDSAMGDTPSASMVGKMTELPTSPTATCDEMVMTWRGAMDLGSGSRGGEGAGEDLHIASRMLHRQILL